MYQSVCVCLDHEVMLTQSCGAESEMFSGCGPHTYERSFATETPHTYIKMFRWAMEYDDMTGDNEWQSVDRLVRCIFRRRSTTRTTG